MKLLLQLSISFAILFISLPSSHSCNSIEKNALLQIKKSFNNPRELSTWNPRTDCCTDWNGVFCTNGRVTELDILSGNLPGQIPDQIGDLVQLRHLEITDMPRLSGNIPRTITKLKNLDLLMFRQTNLSGLIPDYISELKSVTFLDLAFNQFTGPIPGSISQMPKLETLRINDNKLTGSVPDSFGYFVGNLTVLNLQNNKLSGKIPESLSKHDFIDVNLSGNRFIGDGSMFFGRNKRTELVDLSRNKFEFDLSKVKFAKSVAFLHLSQNRIFGKLPGELTKLPLDQFNVSYNRLCGKIPRGGFLQTFEPSAYSHNLCLCGDPLKPC
ncbi:Leucine-rich repeat (LRR) family protein [Raphanus sativus]|uniref:Leucine-rich repeat protein FLOR 1 n=1 Tax=Raphanus sativus TaxID=3726 RepID=A0A6J0NLI6_RAPSA|nr:leucine-rich repeat protein FLOR 1 [Raphanus sativus]KAJ4893431.1 Leucine-rich repeat (LRR) family protein [Raphanus sativus]